MPKNHHENQTGQTNQPIVPVLEDESQHDEDDGQHNEYSSDHKLICNVAITLWNRTLKPGVHVAQNIRNRFLVAFNSFLLYWFRKVGTNDVA